MTTLYGQGTARFSGPEIDTFREEIWKNINSLLVDARKRRADTRDAKPCFWVLGGDRPSEADAVLFGFIIGAMISPA
jgi:hypothetical protein